ncbi:MAG: zinc-dependent alcohol dehydrogenase family protein [Oscillospiraceae bacterium]
MKANVYLGNKQFEVRDLPLRELKDDELLIKVAACGVCGTDIHIYNGSQGASQPEPPVVLGHELSGTVVSTGAGVKGFAAGDHVAVDPNIYCGTCHYCRIGKKHLCTGLRAIGISRDGGFAEMCIVPQAQCYKLSKEVPLEFGAMTEPLACCLHGIDNASIRVGDTVCVIGGGAIGLMMVQLARLSGASTVILSEPIAMRRQVGLELGADYAVDPTAAPLGEQIEKLIGIAGTDVVIECVGLPIAVKQAFEVAKRGTTLLLFSVPQHGSTFELPLTDIFQKELKIVGSMINPDTTSRAVELINSGRIDLAPIITHRYPVEGLVDALHKQMSADSIKVLVVPEQ